MDNFDKEKIKEQLDLPLIFELVQDWGGEPEYSAFGLTCSTVCHNVPGEGSRKLYYYENTKLFKCYTGCNSSFDIFELCIKVQSTQQGYDYDLNQAVLYIAERFGFAGEHWDISLGGLEDWKVLLAYSKIQALNKEDTFQYKQLKAYDDILLNRLLYPKIADWEDEGITSQVIQLAKIGYYPGGEQITIPHYDMEGRFVGLRGRSLVTQEAKLYGKYRPLLVNQLLYTHPLGLNLYNLNNSYQAIQQMKKVIVFEGEKSCLLYRSLFGIESDISVACCGSSLSAYQAELLLRLGVEEIVIAFDRQFQEIGDTEFQHLKTNLIRLHDRYNTYATVSFLFDKQKLLPYKASPVDSGREIFLALFKDRITL